MKLTSLPLVPYGTIGLRVMTLTLIPYGTDGQRVAGWSATGLGVMTLTSMTIGAIWNRWSASLMVKSHSPMGLMVMSHSPIVGQVVTVGQ